MKASKIVLMRDAWKKRRKMSQSKLNDTYAISALNSVDLGARRRKKGAPQEEVNFLAWAGVPEDIWTDIQKLYYIAHFIGRIVRGAGGSIIPTCRNEWGYDPKEGREVQLVVVRFKINLRGLDGNKVKYEYNKAVERRRKW